MFFQEMVVWTDVWVRRKIDGIVPWGRTSSLTYILDLPCDCKSVISLNDQRLRI